MQQALAAPVNWQRVLFLAHRHRVPGLVADALKQQVTVPSDVRQSFAKTQQEVAQKNLQALRTQVQLANLLQRRDIPFAVLKGLPLMMQAYGNLTLRQSRDIDLLVQPEDVPVVDKLLQTIGYLRSGVGAQLSPLQQQLWMSARKHFEYANPSSATSLELHWRTTDNRFLFQPSNPFRGLQMVQVAPNITLPVLSKKNLLLDLCLHGAGHAWFRLKWLADIFVLLTQAGDTGQHQLLATAKQHGLERPVLQAMHLCRDLFGLRLVKTAERLSIPAIMLIDIAAEALLEEDVSAPTTSSDFVPKRLALSHLLLRRGWRYRAEELRLNLSSPVDWQQLPVSARQHWMYPLLRVPLWLKRRWLDPRRSL